MRWGRWTALDFRSRPKLEGLPNDMTIDPAVTGRPDAMSLPPKAWVNGTDQKPMAGALANSPGGTKSGSTSL